jgi:nitroreductase
LAGAGVLALGAAEAAYISKRRMGSMRDYEASVAITRAALSRRPELPGLIRLATLAPNGHNTQPWHFQIADDRIDVLPDLSRRTPVVDPDDHHLHVGLGCAAENLAIAANARGHAGGLEFNAAGSGTIGFVFGEEPGADLSLVDAITRRQSTRAEFDGRQVGSGELRKLVDAADMPGVDLVVLTARPDMERMRDLVVAGNTAQMADPAFIRELKSWLRFSPRRAMTSGDGLFSAASGNPALPEWLGSTAFDLLFRAASENDKYARQLRSSSGVAVFVGDRADPEHWVRVGRACQRFALQATALGLKHAFVNQPVEVPGLRPELAALVGLPGRRPDIVMRFGYGQALPFSARRDVGIILAS